MSSSSDDRVVTLRMRIEEFASNAKLAIGMLGQLGTALNDTNGAKGLDEINAAARRLDFSGLTMGLSQATEQFSALGIMGIRILQNIADQAFATGKRLVSSLSVDNISAGFNKYEEKTKSVQTIMNATGLSIDEVNAQLEKLNWYTDETSYSFNDMVSNIGKFTAMKIPLDTAVQAMEGIANWAAVSGQGANEAARAMYNLSQAIGTGSVKLIDWNSIVNANMATSEFMETAIDTAKALGVLNKAGKTKGKGTLVSTENFRDTLSEGWFTKDVLLETLQKYGAYTEEVYKVATEEGLTAADAMKKVSSATMELGAKSFKAAQEAKTFTDAIEATREAVGSGWSNSFEIIFGNYEEAKVLWTDLANFLYEIFAEPGFERNEILETWKELGGQTTMINAAKNAWAALAKVFELVRNAWEWIFPPKTVDEKAVALVSLTVKINHFMESLLLTGSTAGKVRHMFEGFFAALDIGWMLIKAVAGAIKSVLAYILPASTGFLDFGMAVGDGIVDLRNYLKETDFFATKLAQLGAFLRPVGDLLRTILGYISEVFIAFRNVDFLDIGKSIQDFFGRLTIVKYVTAGIAYLKQSFTDFLNWIVPQMDDIAGAITNAINSVIESFKSEDGAINFDKILNAAVVGVGLKSVIDLVKKIKEGFGSISSIKESITGVFNSIGESLNNFAKNIDIKNLLLMATAITLLAISVKLLGSMDIGDLAEGMIAITLLFKQLNKFIEDFSDGFDTKQVAAFKAISSFLKSLAASILILAASMYILAQLEPAQLVLGLAAVSLMLLELTKVVEHLTKQKLETKLKNVSKGLIPFAVSIVILTTAVKKLGELDIASLAKGVAALGVVMAELGIFLSKTDFKKFGAFKATGLIALAASMLIFYEAIAKFGALDPTQLVVGMTSVGVILAALGAFVNATKEAKGVFTTAVGLTVLAAAMLIFAQVIEKLGAIPLEQLGNGFLALGGSLAMVALFVRTLPKAKGMLAQAASILLIAAAIRLMVPALVTLAEIELEKLGTALLGLGGALGIMVLALNLMKGTVGGAAALTLMSVALLALVPALIMLSDLNLEQIGMMAVALAAGLGVLVGAGYLMSPVAGVISGVALSLAALAAAIALMIAAITAGDIVGTLFGITGAISQLATLEVIRQFVLLLPQLLIDLVVALVQGLSEVANALLDTLTQLLQLILAKGPEFLATGMQVLLMILQGINEYLPELIDAGITMVVELIDGLTRGIPELARSAVDLVVSFAEALGNELPRLIDAGYHLVLDTIKAIADFFRDGVPELLDALAELGIAIAQGLVNGIVKGFPKVVDAGKQMGSALINLFKDTFGIHSPSVVFQEFGVYLMEGLSEGIKKDTKPEEAIKMKVQNISTAFKNEVDNINLAATTRDLQNKMFEALYGDKETDAEYAARQTALLSQQMSDQYEMVSLALGKYNQLMETVGETATETRQAYNDYLQQQLNLIELQKQYEAITSAHAKELESKRAKYSMYLAEYRNAIDLLDSGFSEEDMQKAAAQRAGLTLDEALGNVKSEIDSTVADTMGTIGDAYAMNAEATLNTVAPSFQNMGDSYAKAVGTGIQLQTPSVNQQVTNMSTSALNTLDGDLSKWRQYGVDAISGFIQGMEDKTEALVEAAAELSKKAYIAAGVAIGAASPAKKFIQLGKWADDGFIVGMNANASSVYNASSNVGISAANGLAYAVEQMGLLLDDELNIEPIITPVVDMENVSTAASYMNGIFTGSHQLDVSPSVTRAAQVSAASSRGSSSSDASSTSSASVYTFNQYNTSPKALSAIDIYRQTNNQFSRFKEVTRK